MRYADRDDEPGAGQGHAAAGPAGSFGFCFGAGRGSAGDGGLPLTPALPVKRALPRSRRLSPGRAARPRVRGLVRGAEASRRHVRVDLRRGQALVPEQLLDDAQVRPAVEEVRGERVPQRVRRDALGQPGAPAQAIDPVAEAADTERRALVVEEDRVGLGLAGPDAARRARGEPRRGMPRGRRSRAARAARCAPCGPSPAPGSRRGRGRPTRASPPRAR